MVPQQSPFEATSKVKAMTSAYAVIPFDGGGDAIPVGFLPKHLRILLSAIANTPTGVTWYLSSDAAGDLPLTPATTTTILVGQSGATVGAVCVDLTTLLPLSLAAGIWIWAKLAGGAAPTASGEAHMVGVRS